MKKMLEITVDSIDMDNGEVVCHISKQSHRGDEFGREEKWSKSKQVFVANNGVTLLSVYVPDYSGFCKVYVHPEYSGFCKVYVQGSSRCCDNDLIYIPISGFSKVLEAIREYNEFEFPEEKHTIVIDGKTIEISNESYEALKKSLK